MTSVADHILAQSSFAHRACRIEEIPAETPMWNRVYRFVADGCDFILKAYAEHQQWANEREALRLLSKCRVPTLVEAGGESEGCAGWSIQTFMVGDMGWERRHDVPADVFVELGREVARIHSAYRPGYSGSIWNASARYDDWWVFTDTKFREGIAFIASKELMTRELRDVIEKSYGELRAELRGSMSSCLIHRDLRPSNIRVQHAQAGWRFVGLIDFEHAIAGDAWFDLARLHDEYLITEPCGAKAFWSGYEDSIVCDLSKRERHFALYGLLRCVRGAQFAHKTGDDKFLRRNLVELEQRCE